jgi:putative membrane protein
MSEVKRDNILVLSVDRDNDLGEKTSFDGPVFGRPDVVRAATELGISDPEDSDFNAIFQGVKLHDEIKKQHNTELVVLTGHRNVGIESDKEITKQLEGVLKKFKADYAILVTDGAEDDHVIPIIQSMVPIMSVKRVIVKQSEQLESTYYKIKDFMSESLDNPKFSRLVFGLPAVILVLFAIFGAEGGRIILGILGAYLLIKGFKLEKYFTSVFDELRTTLTRRRFAFFTYMVALIFAGLASYRGYEAITEWLNIGFFETASSFVVASIYFYFLAGAIAWIGHSISIGSKRRGGRKIVSVPIFGFAVSLVIYNAANIILVPQLSMLTFIFSIVMGFGLMFVALFIEWKY